MKRSVVVICQNEKEKWALILAASRSGDRWDIWPIIFAVDSGDSFFAKCPHFLEWSRGLIDRLPGRDLDSDARVELLNNAVLHQVAEIASTSKILELRDSERNRTFPNAINHSHWGLWSPGAARPQNLFFRNPTALNWLTQQRGDAYSALKILYKLVSAHQRTDFTQEEREDTAMKQILGREYYRNVGY